MKGKQVFRFIREVVGQPPHIWRVGDIITYDPSEQYPNKLEGDVLTTWSGHGVYWSFEIGKDIELVTPQVGHYYWIRLYRDDAPWVIARRGESNKSMTPASCWFIFDNDYAYADLEYYDTEVNEVGPEILPPPQ